MTGKSASRWLVSILPALILAIGVIGTPKIATAQPSTTAPPPEVCKNCHANYYETYKTHKHSTKSDPRTPANRGDCAACHGDGTAHAKAGGGRGVGGIVNPASKTLAAEAKNSICLTCHQGGKRIHWAGSTHATRDTTCVSCHQVHTAQDKVRDKATQTEVCFACHQDKRAEISRPSRHPILEGKVACSDCHNPHGTAGPALLVRDSVNDTCYQCHMEKRGPFVRPHNPATEDCAICHNPHGTTNAHLLKARIPFLCQQCHEPTSHRGQIASRTATSTSAGTLARGCENCHTNIHGTNNPANISNERTLRR